MGKIKRRKIVLILTALVIITGGIIAFNYLRDVKAYQETVGSMTFTEIDLSKIPNGIYEGECDVSYIYAKVKVTIKDNKINHIQLIEHKNQRGASAVSIIDTILEEQKIDVDTVSGATNSSKVIKKAVENALKGK